MNCYPWRSLYQWMPLYKWIFLVSFIPVISVAANANSYLDFPATPCTSAWKDYEKTSYLYHSGLHQGYRHYLDAMKQNGIDRTQCHKTWTVLVYMSVTQDLVPYAIADLIEMESELAGSSLRADILVQLNHLTRKDSRRYHLFEMNSDPFRPLKPTDVSQLTEPRVQSPVVSTSSISSSSQGDSESKRFEDFLKWAIAEYPSEHYLVIVWGHGQSWNGVATSSVPGIRGKAGIPTSFCRAKKSTVSPTSPTTLDLPALRGVLKSIKKWRGEAIEIFASDTCLMQSVEDVAELSRYSQFICGSEAIASYAGFPYRDILCELNTGNFDQAPQRASSAERAYGEPYLAAWMIPELYKESFQPETGSQGALDPVACQDLTECSVSSKHLRSTLIPSLNQLGKALVQFIEEKRERWIDVRFAINRGNFFRGGTQDLGAFLKRIEKLAAEEEATPATLVLRKAISRSAQALEYSIVNYALGEDYLRNPAQAGARGLSIWLPKTKEDYQSRIRDFAHSRFYQDLDSDFSQGWSKWMELMYPVHLM